MLKERFKIRSILNELGYWGYADLKTRGVHVWIKKYLDGDILTHLLAHEIGHLLEDAPLSDNPAVACEERADRYGLAAVIARKFYYRLFKYVEVLPGI